MRSRATLLGAGLAPPGIGLRDRYRHGYRDEGVKTQIGRCPNVWTPLAGFYGFTGFWLCSRRQMGLPGFWIVLFTRAAFYDPAGCDLAARHGAPGSSAASITSFASA